MSIVIDKKILIKYTTKLYSMKLNSFFLFKKTKIIDQICINKLWYFKTFVNIKTTLEKKIITA